MEKFTSIFLTMILLFLLSFESRAYSSNTYQADTSSSGYQRVVLAVYYETLCPYCAEFIAGKLGDLFDKGLTSIVDLQLVPWGNAGLLENGTITCQHGEDECALNKVEACVIELWPGAEDRYRYLQCTEQRLIDGQDIKSCFSQADRDTIDRCYGTIGEQLVLKHKAKTDCLNPPHTFVPWVTVNNQPLLKDYQNYIKYVCNAYKGPAPEECKLVAIQEDEEKEILESQVCYASDDKQSSREKILRKKN